MEPFKSCFKNVLTYSAGSDQMFGRIMKDFGYEKISTFFGDLSTAEWFGVDSIKETYKNVLDSWSDNVKMFTEFVMALNHKSWFWYETKQFEYDVCDNKTLSGLYAELYEKAYDFICENWNEENKDYFFRVTD